MIHQLKGQLEELESYAYASGEGTMPSNVLLERQRVVMGKFILSLYTVEFLEAKKLSEEELKTYNRFNHTRHCANKVFVVYFVICNN